MNDHAPRDLGGRNTGQGVAIATGPRFEIERREAMQLFGVIDHAPPDRSLRRSNPHS